MQAGYDFDRVIDRRSTGSVKWQRSELDDVVPMGIADMDFPSPPCVLEALEKRIRHGIFGYTTPTDELAETIRTWLKQQYQWEIETDWLVWLPGLVPGLNAVVRAVVDAGEQVLTAVPVYPPFLTASNNMNRELVTAQLRYENSHWTFDFDRVEDAITSCTRLFMLSNPHNPVGRAYTEDELTTLTKICMQHELVICADEIHCDLILDQDRQHIPLARLTPEYDHRIVTLMSPSKTFNLAGIGCGYAVIPDADLRQAFRTSIAGIVPHVSALGYAACQAAYQHGSAWLRALLDYLRGNRDLVLRSISSLPGLSISPIEATYLAWIDTRRLELDNPAHHFLQAGVHLWDGANFEGSGFVRLNFALPRSRLQEGLQRIEHAVAQPGLPNGSRAGT